MYGGVGLRTYLNSRNHQILKIAGHQLKIGERPNDNALAQASKELSSAALDPLGYIDSRIRQVVQSAIEVDTTSVSPGSHGHFDSKVTFKFKPDVQVVAAASAEYKQCRRIQYLLAQGALAEQSKRLAALPTPNRPVVDFLVALASDQVNRVDPKRESPYTNPFNDANNTDYGNPARLAVAGLRRLAGIQNEQDLLIALDKERASRRTAMHEATEAWKQAGQPKSGDAYNRYYLASVSLKEAVQVAVVNPPVSWPRPAERLNP